MYCVNLLRALGSRHPGGRRGAIRARTFIVEPEVIPAGSGPFTKMYKSIRPEPHTRNVAIIGSHPVSATEPASRPMMIHAHTSSVSGAWSWRGSVKACFLRIGPPPFAAYRQLAVVCQVPRHSQWVDRGDSDAQPTHLSMQISMMAFALTTDRSKNSARDQRGVIDITGLRLPKREYAARQEA